MNWELFMQFIFAMWMIRYFLQGLCGIFDVKKPTQYDLTDVATSAVGITVLTLMWFWT